MAEPLKFLYTQTLIENLSSAITSHYCEFDREGFSAFVFDETWDDKELKERMNHISVGLHRFIPIPYIDAVKILVNAAAEFNGFEYMFFPGFIELYGLDNFAVSISALESMTPFASSEFAVRPFIIKYPEQMIETLMQWSRSPNHHVRRLASEGCRPRLPWAMALPEYKKDPTAILPILENLKADDSEYVRRSVANNLNDIAKDHPDIVISIAQQWLGKSKETDRLVKHACRTLLKQGLPTIMKLFGYADASNFKVADFICAETVMLGEELNFKFKLTNKSQIGLLRLEYGISFLRKNGTHSKKVFKISESVVDHSSKEVEKAHSFKIITTRKYYSGKQYLTVIANGIELAETTFQLTQA